NFCIGTLGLASHRPSSRPHLTIPARYANSLALDGDSAEPPLSVNCIVNQKIKTLGMIDCGASSQFIDSQFAKKHNLILERKTVPIELRVVDGTPSSAGPITHEVRVQLQIDQHLETLVMNVTKLFGFNVILGKTWLRRHNPPIDW